MSCRGLNDMGSFCQLWALRSPRGCFCIPARRLGGAGIPLRTAGDGGEGGVRGREKAAEL